MFHHSFLQATQHILPSSIGYKNSFNAFYFAFKVLKLSSYLI